MKKINGMIGALSIAAAIVLSGCQTDDTNSNTNGAQGSANSSNTKSAKVRASDAYVVALQSAATMKAGNQEFNTTDVEENGTIVFKGIPKDLNLSDATVYIPGDAIVDTDGDGVLSSKDQIIRMALKAKGIDGIANQLATLALEQNDTKAYEEFKNFDPVKAKIDLIKNPDNEQLKVLVAISDAVAMLAKEAKNKDKNVTEVTSKIKLSLIKRVMDKTDTVSDLQAAIIDTIDEASQEAEVSEDNITKNVLNVIKVINTAHDMVENGDENATADKLVSAVIAVSDGDANATAVEQDIKKGMLDKVKEHIKENPIVKKHIHDRGNFNGGNGFDFGMHGNSGDGEGNESHEHKGGEKADNNGTKGGMDNNKTHNGDGHKGGFDDKDHMKDSNGTKGGMDGHKKDGDEDEKSGMKDSNGTKDNMDGHKKEGSEDGKDGFDKNSGNMKDNNGTDEGQAGSGEQDSNAKNGNGSGDMKGSGGNDDMSGNGQGSGDDAQDGNAKGNSGNGDINGNEQGNSDDMKESKSGNGTGSDVQDGSAKNGDNSGDMKGNGKTDDDIDENDDDNKSGSDVDDDSDDIKDNNASKDNGQNSGDTDSDLTGNNKNQKDSQDKNASNKGANL